MSAAAERITYNDKKIVSVDGTVCRFLLLCLCYPVCIVNKIRLESIENMRKRRNNKKNELRSAFKVLLSAQHRG